MAQSQDIAGHVGLQAVVGEEAVQKAARAFGVVKRQRKVDVFMLFWTLVLGGSVGAARTLLRECSRSAQIEKADTPLSFRTASGVT